MFSSIVEAEIRIFAEVRKIDPAGLLAVAEVESDGAALAEIGGRLMPTINYEFHVFHRQLRPAARGAAVAAGLAAPRWGQIAYPKTQRERHLLFERAKLIDAEAAYAACAWGVGRVLGEHASWLDYENAEALAQDAMGGVAGQMRVMLRFVGRRGLLDALAGRDWTTFARGYAGPLQERSDYAGRLARAHARWSMRSQAQAGLPTDALVAMGSVGPEVAALQRALAHAGQNLVVDGKFGVETRSAVRRFQAAEGLVRDGVAGQRTWARLNAVVAETRAAQG